MSQPGIGQVGQQGSSGKIMDLGAARRAGKDKCGLT